MLVTRMLHSTGPELLVQLHLIEVNSCLAFEPLHMTFRHRILCRRQALCKCLVDVPLPTPFSHWLDPELSSSVAVNPGQR